MNFAGQLLTFRLCLRARRADVRPRSISMSILRFPQVLKRPAAVAALAASGGAVLAVAPVGAAHAVDYPTWGDVQKAKADVAHQEAMISQIDDVVAALQVQAQTTREEADRAAENYFQACDRLVKASKVATDLKRQAEEAKASAQRSRIRAELIAAHLARSVEGESLTARLFLNGSRSAHSDDRLLAQLGMANTLSIKTREIFQRARTDANLAASLATQASAAMIAREKLVHQAQAAQAAAEHRNQQVRSTLAAQQAHIAELASQLAELKNTSVQSEAAYLRGVQNNRLAPPAPAPQPSPPAPAPKGDIAAIAIAFARAQLGKPYIFGGEGPDGFDCSGLTVKAYASAGVYIGTHSVNDQFQTAAARGQIVPYSQRQAGDLIFWGENPGDFYHVGLYIGGEMMIAAPSEGDVVKIQSVWGSPWHQVARPSA